MLSSSTRVPVKLLFVATCTWYPVAPDTSSQLSNGVVSDVVLPLDGEQVTGELIVLGVVGFLHPTRNHGITVRHAARFQTFPDNFIFSGGIMAAAKQVGNAVPIKLGSKVLGTITNALKDAQ